jgi:glycosyltransferase involved in cell wall biosynthesis
MKRFGSIFPFLESGQRERHIGRLVANHDFAKAVLRYGDFDEFVFSNTSVRNLAVFMEAAAGWGLPPGRLDRVRCVGYADLPGVLRTTDFEVFHLGGWGWMMPGLHYVRARYAPVCWPITAVIHSLSGREVIDHAVRLSHASLAPNDAIFCTSRDGRGAMARLLAGGARIAGRSFAGQLLHLPLGIEDELLDAGGNRERGRARLKIPADAVVLLVLGRITPTQKMDLGPLCRLLARRVLPSSPVPVVLLLAGSATPHDLTRAKSAISASGLEAHVRLHANFPLKDKPDVLAMSDILVSPVDNTQETFGLSLLEAMAAGLPVVASRFDGYKDLVEDDVDGFLVDTWWGGEDPMGEWFDLMDPDIAQLFQSQGVAVDLEQLGDRLLTLVADPARRTAMGRAGRAKVAATYRWSRVIAAYERTWSRLRREVGERAPEATGENPYCLGPSQAFLGYASRQLEPGTRLRAVSRTLDEAPYNETAPLLVRPLLQAVLNATEESTTVECLLKAVRAPADRVMFAVRWLLKYGFLVAG